MKMTPEELIRLKAGQLTAIPDLLIGLYEESGITAYEFCCIFPNNVLKRYGIPTRRGCKAKFITRKTKILMGMAYLVGCDKFIEYFHRTLKLKGRDIRKIDMDFT